jgi:hydrogenase nickel incorporation protein HypB
VLDKNDRLAHELRQRFAAAGVLAVNLVSSPGTGKTALLEETLRRLVAGGWRAAALVGDLATANDAHRLARSGAPVRQIETGTLCHLEADLVSRHLAGWELRELDFLFVENVGNLVCPADYDLGESLRVVLLAVTEGEDKPLKYPPLFSSADVAVITKVDMAAAAGFDRATTLANLAAVRPGIAVFETSARTGQGLAEWVDFLVARRQVLTADADSGFG